MDLEPIRLKAIEVKTAMAQDCGPIEAEPYSTWAEELADYVLDLLWYIDKMGDDSFRYTGLRLRDTE